MELPVLLVAAVVCICLWTFIDLAEDTREGGFVTFDTEMLLSLRSAEDVSKPIGPVWLAGMSRDVTALGSATVLILMTLLIVGYLLMLRSFSNALFLAAAAGGGYAISQGLKALIDRPRPDVVPHLTDVVSASFPSGHSLVASVIYLTLGTLLASRATRRREKTYFIGAALFLSALVGVSRVYLGVHYPTDVLAGWSAGVAWSLICWLALRWLQRRGAIRPTVSGE